MYHKELYNEHNESLDRFIKIFNSTNPKNLLMIRKPVEDYKHDGLLIDMVSGNNFGFDWTKSQNILFNENGLKYQKLACINSKLNTKTSQLLITTDLQENQIAVSWHNDFIEESVQYFTYMTKEGKEILRTIRYTQNFKTYTYNNIECFKNMIQEALDTQTFNHTIFNTEDIYYEKNI